jgi:hypothetical protein
MWKNSGRDEDMYLIYLPFLHFTDLLFFFETFVNLLWEKFVFVRLKFYVSVLSTSMNFRFFTVISMICFFPSSSMNFVWDFITSLILTIYMDHNLFYPMTMYNPTIYSPIVTWQVYHDFCITYVSRLFLSHDVIIGS